MQVLLLTTIASFLLSFLSAVLADTYLSRRIPLFGDFMGLQHSVNPGIAWGMRLQGGVQEVLIAIALIVVAVLAVRNVRLPKGSGTPPPANRPKIPDPVQPIAFGMILGGGLANIVDRLKDGVVTDYVQVGTFPIFNVADSCVTLGVALLLWGSLFSRRKKA